MAKKKSKPTSPYGLYNSEDFNYQQMMTQTYFNTYVNWKIMLYRINTIKSVKNSIYGESKPTDKEFLTPVEITIIPTIGDVEMEYKGKDGINNQKINNFTFGVYKEELTNKNLTIKNGDYVIYNDGETNRVYEIITVSELDTNNSAYGFKPFYKNIKCKLVLGDTTFLID